MRHVIRDLYENKYPYPCLKVAVFLNLYRVIAVVMAALQQLLYAPSFFSVIHRKYVAEVICTANLNNVRCAIIAALAML